MKQTSQHRTLYLIICCCLMAVVLLVWPRAERAQQPAVKTADQVYKNIQVFKKLPASELDQTMAFIAGSLGVKCNHCHTNPWEKDDKLQKQTARRMIQMVFDLNKGSFAGENGVTCFTCHRGKPIPVSVPAVGQNLWAPGPAAAKEEALPTVDEVLAKYVEATGGAATLKKVTTRVTKGSRIGADNVLVPEEVFQKAPNKLMTITSYPNAVLTSAYNGSEAWGKSGTAGIRDLPEGLVAMLKVDADFYRELRTKESYAKLTLTGKENVRDSDAWVIAATPAHGSMEKLFFDVRSGLLVRRYTESDTIFGKFPLQTDYEDYRDVDGIKLPFLIHWSMPGRIWGRKIAEIKQNVPVDDAQFDRPKN